MAKYDKSKLVAIFEATKDKGYRAFVAEAKKLGMSEKSAASRFYIWKKKPPTLSSQENVEGKNIGEGASTVNNPQVEVITPTSVHVETAPVQEEGSTLRDKYKKMYEEVAPVGEEPSSKEEASMEGEAAPSGPEVQPKVAVKIGELFYQLGVALNNNLLWNERQLHDDEKNFIKMSSDDIETTFNPNDLNREDAPWINYALAVMLVPTLSRVDLIPAKIDAVRNWFRSMSRNKGNVKFNEPVSDIGKYQTETPTTEINGVNAAVWNNLSDNQKVWVKNCVDAGYKVSPNWNPNGLLDRDAYMENKIFRNKGDTWSG